MVEANFDLEIKSLLKKKNILGRQFALHAPNGNNYPKSKNGTPARIRTTNVKKQKDTIEQVIQARKVPVLPILKTKQNELEVKSVSARTPSMQRTEFKKQNSARGLRSEPQRIDHLSNQNAAENASNQGIIQNVSRGTKIAFQSTKDRKDNLGKDKDRKNTITNDRHGKSKEDKKIEMDWLGKNKQLNHRVYMLEREIAAACGVYLKKDISNTPSRRTHRWSFVNEELTNCFAELEDERCSDHRLLARKVTTLANLVNKFKFLVYQTTEKVDIDQVKQYIEQIEEEMEQIRTIEVGVYGELLRQEHILNNELTAFQESMESWNEKMQDTTIDKRQLEKEMLDKYKQEGSSEFVEAITAINNEIYAHDNQDEHQWLDKEVAIFEKNIVQTGFTESFILEAYHCYLESKNENHSTTDFASKMDKVNQDAKFLRVDVRVNKLISICVAQLPTRSRQEILDHFYWFAKRLHLLTIKKENIQSWRNSRTNQNRHQASKLEEPQHENTLQAEEAKEMRQRKRDQKNKLALQQWHAKKKERELQEQKTKQAAEAEHAARKSSQKQLRAEEKQKLQLYRLRKEQEEALRSQQQNLQQSLPRKKSKAFFEEEASRAIHKALEKRHKLKQKEVASDSVVESRIASSKSTTLLKTNVQRDPERLVKDTSASASRTITVGKREQMENDRRRTSAHNLRVNGGEAAVQSKVKNFGHVPIQPRSVPTWRRNL